MNDKLDGASLDIERMELEKLRTVFPQCFSEGRLDVSKLLSLCGEYDDNDFEKYKFEWKGKSVSLRQAQQRSTGTLRPCLSESVDWDTTQNLYIEGDNLEVLKLLQTAYYRKVKMIYIDPPYNTGNDFVYSDDFADPIKHYKEITSQTTKSNPETMGRFHTNWLNMMYPRLRLAANLLTDDGVIFISIDDKEVHNLRKLCDEIFGEENFISQISWMSKSGGSADEKYIVNELEYIFVYAKSINNFVAGKISLEKDERYKLTDDHLNERGKYLLKKLDFRMTSAHYTESLNYGITDPDGNILWPGGGNSRNDGGWNWRWSKDKMKWGFENDFLEFKKKGDVWILNSKQYEFVDNNNNKISRNLPYRNFISSKDFNTTSASRFIVREFGSKIFEYAKPTDLITQFIKIANTTENAIILDFFSGSATTAHAVMQLNKEDNGNRRFICVQLPELTDENSEANKAGYKNICEIGKERIRRSGAKIKSEWEAEAAKRGENLFSGEEPPRTPPDTGFRVFKLDTSNLRTWDAAPVDNDDHKELELLFDRMNEMITTIKNDRTDLDVVYEIMLKMGVPPTYCVTPVEIDGKRAYSIGEECLLLVCLQEGLTAATIERMAEDYFPAKMILSEKCFADDTAMANAHYILKERDIELKLV